MLAVVIQQSSWSVGHAIPAVASAVACLLMVRLIRSVRLADGRITALTLSGQ